MKRRTRSGQDTKKWGQKKAIGFPVSKERGKKLHQGGIINLGKRPRNRQQEKTGGKKTPNFPPKRRGGIGRLEKYLEDREPPSPHPEEIVKRRDARSGRGEEEGKLYLSFYWKGGEGVEPRCISSQERTAGDTRVVAKEVRGSEWGDGGKHQLP